MIVLKIQEVIQENICEGHFSSSIYLEAAWPRVPKMLAIWVIIANMSIISLV